MFQLVVTETGTAQLYSSDPSLTVVTVNPGANAAPAVSATSISVGHGVVVTRQVNVTDADDWQAHSYLITKQSSLGNASISSTGLLTFISSSTDGSDPITVLVFDNGTPPLSGSFSLPVTVTK